MTFPRVIIFIACSISFSAWSSESARVRIYHPREHDRKPLEIQLSKKAASLWCKTKEVPRHRISVRGMKNLKAPFKTTADLQGCEKVAIWQKDHEKPVTACVMDNSLMTQLENSCLD